MMDLAQHDAQIRDLYTSGTPSLEIARLLDIDLIDVVGRVRAMELQPPGMGVRRDRAALTPRSHPAQGAVLPLGPEPEPVAMAADVCAAPASAEATGKARPTLGTPQPRRSSPPSRPAGIIQRVAPPGRAAVPAYAEDEDDEDEMTGRHPGRPRGWLMAETEVEALFARAGQRFQDVALRRRA